MSEIKVNSIKGVGATAAAITVNNSDGTCTANITSNGGGPLSNRNMVINGGMMINQRYGDSAHTPTDGVYTMDRWQAWMSTTGKFSVTRSDDHPDDFAKSLLVTSLSAATVTANHEHGITTKIEAQNMSQLAFGTSSAKSATLSFFVKCSLTGTFGGLVANSALNMSYVFSYTVNSANTWERKTITIPPTTSGSFGSGSSNGLQVHFEFGIGSNRTAAVGWQTNTAVRGVNSQVNLIATNAATWRMTGLQLEVGTTATEFEHRSFGDESKRCYRYFQRLTSNENYQWVSLVAFYSNTEIHGFLKHFETMRAVPTLSVTTGSNTFAVQRAGGAVSWSTGIIKNGGDMNMTYFYRDGVTLGTSGQCGRCLTWTAGSTITLSAEL